MRIVGYLNLVTALILTAGILFMELCPESWVLDSEKTFIAGLHNSLYYLDEAKLQWAEEMHKSDADIPTLEALTPYLNDKGERIREFMALGISYTITPIAERQSDVATLKADLRFRRGICLYYFAGTRLSLRTGWKIPSGSFRSSSFFLQFLRSNLDVLFKLALSMLVLGNLLVFVIKRIRRTKLVAGQ